MTGWFGEYDDFCDISHCNFELLSRSDRPAMRDISRVAARKLSRNASVLSEARIRNGVSAVTMPWRAFDKTVSRKPLAFAVDAVYGNSIDLGLEAIGKKGVAGKAWLLMQRTAPVVHPGLLAAPVLLSSAETLAPMHEAASAAQAA